MKIKPTLAALAIAMLALLPLSAQAQLQISGTYSVVSVRDVKPPKGTSLTLAFADGGKATLRYQFNQDAAQTFAFRYSVEGVLLSLEPAEPFGKANSVKFEIRVTNGQLQLLPPKTPEQEKAEAAALEKGEKTEDTRQPVWVLAKG